MASDETRKALKWAITQVNGYHKRRVILQALEAHERAIRREQAERSWNNGHRVGFRNGAPGQSWVDGEGLADHLREEGLSDDE